MDMIQTKPHLVPNASTYLLRSRQHQCCRPPQHLDTQLRLLSRRQHQRLLRPQHPRPHQAQIQTCQKVGAAPGRVQRRLMSVAKARHGVWPVLPIVRRVKVTGPALMGHAQHHHLRLQFLQVAAARGQVQDNRRSVATAPHGARPTQAIVALALVTGSIQTTSYDFSIKFTTMGKCSRHHEHQFETSIVPRRLRRFAAL